MHWFFCLNRLLQRYRSALNSGSKSTTQVNKDALNTTKIRGNSYLNRSTHKVRKKEKNTKSQIQSKEYVTRVEVCRQPGYPSTLLTIFYLFNRTLAQKQCNGELPFSQKIMTAQLKWKISNDSMNPWHSVVLWLPPVLSLFSITWNFWFHACVLFLYLMW